MKNNVTIAGVEIYQDDQGRYNLNALHKSSGNDLSKAPAQWLRLKGTQELIEELTDMQIHTSLVNSVKGGVEQGTFVHELLAVSYAGWISASFQLKVNQAFIDSKKPKQEIALPETYLEALKALVVSEEEKILIAHERDEAIRTKAMIGSKREATAMAKASAESKRAKALEIKLDESNEYATLKRMEIYYKRSFSWRLLKKSSIELGLPMMKAQDANYGEVNTYHKDVWKSVYNLEIK